MSGKIAQTSFVVGPDDKAAPLDVYEDKEAKNTEEVSSSSDSEGGILRRAAINASNALRGRDGLAVEIAETIDVDDGEVSFNRKEGVSRLRDATGGFEGPIDEISEKIVDKALGAMGFKDEEEEEKKERLGDGGTSPGKKNKSGHKLKTKRGIKTLIGGVQKFSNHDSDLSTANGVVGLLNTFLDDEDLIEVLDIEAQTAVLGTILDEVIRLGIPDAIDMLLQKVEDDKERRRLLLANLRVSVIFSDLVAINKALDYVGAGGVLQRVPDIVELLLTFYRFPRGTTKANWSSRRTELVNTLNRIDSKWDTYDRVTLRYDEQEEEEVEETDVIGDLTPFTYASVDALDLFEADTTASEPNIRRHIAARIARRYPISDMIDEARGMYPRTYIPDG